MTPFKTIKTVKCVKVSKSVRLKSSYKPWGERESYSSVFTHMLCRLLTFPFTSGAITQLTVLWSRSRGGLNRNKVMLLSTDVLFFSTVKIFTWFKYPVNQSWRNLCWASTAGVLNKATIVYKTIRKIPQSSLALKLDQVTFKVRC